VEGARWVQTELLQKKPQADLVVHAIWFEALPVVDKRESWPADLLSDPRVVHHWDSDRLVPRFFGDDPAFRGKGLIGWRGVMWDTYLLFGRDAQWTERPAPVAGAGYTIIAARQQLTAEVESALLTLR
jgi:hypothetical protein